MISPDTITIFVLTSSKYRPYKILISKDATWSCLLDDKERLLFPLTCLWDNTKQFAHVSLSRVISRASKRERVWYSNVREMKLLELKGCLFLISLKSPSLARFILGYFFVDNPRGRYVYSHRFRRSRKFRLLNDRPVTERFPNSIFSQVL